LSQERLPRIRVICPCFNEVEGISFFFAELWKVLSRLDDYQFEVVFVDDGSFDGTFEKILDLSKRFPQLKVLRFSRNFGHQTALIAGIDSTDDSFSAAILMDADLQHPPSVIPQLLKAWESGNDIVSTIRADSPSISFFKKSTSKLYYVLINLLSDVRILPNCADFCLLGRTPLQALKKMKEKDLFLRGAISWLGFQRSFVTYVESPRFVGTSHYTFSKMMNLALHSVFSFSTKPIKMCFHLGMFSVGLASIYLIYACVLYFSVGTVRGWTSIIACIVFFGGLNMLMLSVLGGYISRIFNEVKDRPRYVISQQPLERGQAADIDYRLHMSTTFGHLVSEPVSTSSL
jgi:glycosyltransferase involved in cell wall biosynthesis